MTASQKQLSQTQTIGRTDGYKGLPANPPFSKHLATAYSLAYVAGQQQRQAEENKS